jgi:hypothetical protein
MHTKTITKVLTIAAAVVAVTAGAASAQAQERVVANVPFDFMVGKVHMPAGQYTVARDDQSPSLVAVSSGDRRHFAFALTNSIALEDTAKTPELIFAHVGQTYYLQRIEDPGSGGRELVVKPGPAEPDVKRVAANYVR